MTELKTLKDIEFIDNTYQGNCDEDNVRETLKQEAIKHIKHLQKGIDILKKEDPNFLKHSGYIYDTGQIEMLIYFFNITKEDLQ